MLNSRPKTKISQRRPLYERATFCGGNPQFRTHFAVTRLDSIVFKYSSQNHLSILFEERENNNENKKETKYTVKLRGTRNKTKIQLFKTEHNQVEFQNKRIDCFL